MKLMKLYKFIAYIVKLQSCPAIWKDNMSNYKMFSAFRYFGGDFSLEHYCAGAIINEYQVLTAAHCFYFPNSADAKSWIVLVGSNNNSLSLAEQGKADFKKNTHEIEEIILHKGFLYPEYINDIAILNMKKPFKLDDHVSKAPLERSGHSPEGLIISSMYVQYFLLTFFILQMVLYVVWQVGVP